jgi:transcriptional regulator of acetoin/glycerol metabolism
MDGFALPLLPLCHWDGNWREPATVIRAIIVAIAEPDISTAEMISDARAQGMSAFVWLMSEHCDSVSRVDRASPNN